MMNVSPGFGISEVTSFSGSASANDPDGDSVSYNWQVGSTSLSGSNFTSAIRGDGNVSVLLTVSDGRGQQATDTRNVTVGSMNGTWTFAITGSCTGQFQMTFTQTGSNITGTSFYPQTLCGVPTGTRGRTDPAVVNSIDANGNVVVREKADVFSDWTFRGVMDASGRRITGTYGPPSGSFVATK
jgi:hypothetical protein